MNKNLFLLGSILLIILVGLWGYYFYNIRYQKNSTPTSTQQTTTTTQTLSQQTISFDDESSLLKYIELPNPTQAQTAKFFEGLSKFAKEDNTVTISQCKTTPIAVKVKLGMDIKVVNTNKVDYTLLRATTKYNLPAEQTITIKTDFGGGAHGYRCDGKGIENQPVAGIFYIVE